MQDKVYWAHEVAGILDVSRSTLRKWALALEAAGYAFARDERARRCYIERDIAVFRRMKVMLGDGMTMENAGTVAIALETPKQTEGMSGSLSMVVHAQNTRLEERYSEVAGHLADMRQENREMREHFERMDQRMQAQHEGISQLLREQLEVRRMIAAAQEKRWWQLWK